MNGIAFTAYLANLKVEPTLDPPMHLLTELGSAAVVSEIEVAPISFSTRFEAAKYLHELLAGYSGAERDAGLWAWLALFYFDQLCPAGKGGYRKPGEHARYVPAVDNFQRYYRHLLLGPYLIYHAHADAPERAAGVLTSRVNAPGDIVEQLASRQELITNRAVMGVVSDLYVDAEEGKLKRGSGGKGAGSPRRLADILNQLDLTFDLYAMDSSQLTQLLPKEFEKFKN